jgi:histidyl-tRNA synthetase
MKKQMKYADDRGIRYVALVGSKEMEEGKLTIKDMKEGSQQSLTKEELVNFLSKNRA